MINIKADSRRIKKGDIFIALRGISSDGHDYIDKAISNGASKLIVEDEKEYGIPYEVVPNTRKYLEEYLKDNYGKYIDEMNIIGITGTNGKTTTAYLIYQMLNRLNIDACYIGTLGYFLKEGKIENLPNTSPDICEMYELIINAYDKGYRNIILETSSQGLSRGRLKGISYDYAIFTNLTQDHLDEHKTMENYALAKKILFDNLKNNGFGIVNFDDQYKDYYTNEKTISYGYKANDFKIIDTKFSSNNTIIKYRYQDKEYEIISSLLGDYNVYNLLGAIIVLTMMNINFEDIRKLTKTLNSPDGRLDMIKYNNNNIIVDYAHTPDAMKKIINTSKLITKGNIYIVFGCTGNRDRTKRPIMMDLACSNCKYVVITIDDLHDEDSSSIVNDMLKDNKHTNYDIILDRSKAIKKGISLLNSDDTLLILGKGHEEFIIKGKEKIPFNDKKEVLKIIGS